ncbi:hypothetical protein F9K92_15705 [Stenotrophomonas rhizophila]|uniref:Uncharacterized protein n=1 Tax=Stenotrophomonas rhizophila TaxID=216778 RepID=A0A7V7YDQ1_9GAMM|nr:hypothetical protein F9K92_15705 [Stenotrophomonas rhizophila]
MCDEQHALKSVAECTDAIWDRVFSFDPMYFYEVGRYLQDSANGDVGVAPDDNAKTLDDLSNAIARSCYLLAGMGDCERPLDTYVLPVRVLLPYLKALASTTPEQRQRILLERALRGSGGHQGRSRKM